MDGLQADTDCANVPLCSNPYDQRTSLAAPAGVQPGFYQEKIYWMVGQRRGSIGGTGGVICQDDRDYSRCV